MPSHKPFSAAGLILCGLLNPAGIRAQEQQAPLPDGPGKEAVQKVCTGCHEIETVTGSRRTEIGWRQSVDDMISRGAEGSDQEMATVVAYLTAHFGKINVNTATAQELQKTLDLAEAEARAIVSYRQQNSKIQNFEELAKIPGTSAEKLQAKRGLIAFSQ